MRLFVFLSYSYDLTHTLQFNMAPLRGPSTKAAPSQSHPQQSQARTSDYISSDLEPDIGPNTIRATKAKSEEDSHGSKEEEQAEARIEASHKNGALSDLRDQEFAISDVTSIRITPTSALDISVQRDIESQRGDDL